MKTKLQRKAATSAAKPSTKSPSTGAATLIFSAAQLDRMFASLDLDGKAACLQGYLDSNDQA